MRLSIKLNLKKFLLPFFFLLFSKLALTDNTPVINMDSERLYQDVMELSQKLNELDLENIFLNIKSPQDFGAEYIKYSQLDPQRQQVMDQYFETKKALSEKSLQLFTLIQTNLSQFPEDPILLASLGILKPLIKSSFPELLDKNGVPNAIEIYKSSIQDLKKCLEIKPDFYSAQHELALNYLSSEELQYILDTEKLSPAEVHNEGWKYVKEAILLLEKGIENAQAKLLTETEEKKKDEIKAEISSMMVALAKQFDWRPEAVSELFTQNNERTNFSPADVKSKALSLFREAFFLTPDRSIPALYFVTTQMLTYYARRDGYYVGDHKVLVMPTKEAQKVNWSELIQANNVLLNSKPFYLFEQMAVTDLFFYRQAIILEIHSGMAQGQINTSNLDAILAQAAGYIEKIGYPAELNVRLKEMQEKYLIDARGILDGSIKTN